MKIIFIETGPDILIFGSPFQVGCYLGDIVKLNDFFQLLICHKPALHGADLGGDSAVGKEISHIASLLSAFKKPVE